MVLGSYPEKRNTGKEQAEVLQVHFLTLNVPSGLGDHAAAQHLASGQWPEPQSGIFPKEPGPVLFMSTTAGPFLISGALRPGPSLGGWHRDSSGKDKEKYIGSGVEISASGGLALIRTGCSLREGSNLTSVTLADTGKARILPMPRKQQVG